MTKTDEEVLFGDLKEPNPPFPGRHRTKDRSGNILADKSNPVDPLEHSSSNPTINKLRTMRAVSYTHLTLPTKA